MEKRKKQFHDKMAPYYDIYSLGIKGDIDFYLKECKKAKGKVLEIACGSGRILIPAMKAGVDIVGLDISQEMTDILKRKAKIENLKPKIVIADMKDFKLKNRFSLIIIPYRSFSHMLTPADQIKALKNFYRHLQAGGRVILNIFNPNLARIAQGKYPKHLRRESKNKFRYWDEGEYDLKNQIIKATQTVELLNNKNKVRKSAKEKLIIRYTFPSEFRLLFELARFKKLEIYDGFTTQEFNSKTKEMVLIAYK